jgi:hypothetical protein
MSNVHKQIPSILLALIASSVSTSILACASCGCTLSSDWESQGLTTHPGLKIDLRYDYLNQNQLRSGTGTISSVAASQINGGMQEVEKFTKNQYITLGLDYSSSPDWGGNVQIPYIMRRHSTLGTSSDGFSPQDDAYDSNTQDLGDIKILGRYQGFSPQHNFGMLFGIKLPTGSHTKTGTSTDPAAPGDPAPIDPGLQPGTGTTDAIIGAYYFDGLNKDWDYFGQISYQAALNSRDQYKPGNGFNLNLGLRYQGFSGLFPQLQLNARNVQHDTGDNADQVSTGGTLVYLSPGAVVPVGKQTSLYGFVQLPIYQDVRGVQLAPKYSASIGARFTF